MLNKIANYDTYLQICEVQPIAKKIVVSSGATKCTEQINEILRKVRISSFSLYINIFLNLSTTKHKVNKCFYLY